MRLADGYKFTLQFKNQSDAHRQVGELLEHAKNKKSDIIVAAVSAYIRENPEVLNEDNPVKVTYGFSEDELKARIDTLIKTQLNTYKPEDQNVPLETSVGLSNDAIDMMLSGVDEF